jgi:anti-anti-sigma factor
MGHFAATTSAEPGRVVVALSGEADLAARDELTAALLTAVNSARVVVVELGALTFLDSSGLHGLVTAHRAAEKRGGRLYLANAAGAVATLLGITGIGALLSPSDEGVHG